MSSYYNTMPNIQQNFDKMEKDILNQVMVTSKSLLESFKFNIIYHSKVSEKQEKETSKMVNDYRKENWNKALKEAKGNKDKAHKIYMKYSKFLN